MSACVRSRVRRVARSPSSQQRVSRGDDLAKLHRASRRVGMRRARRALKRRLDLAVRRTRVARESERRAVPREIVHRARASPRVVFWRARRGGRGDRPRPTARSYARAVTMYLYYVIVFITEHPRTGVACAPIEMTPNVRTRDVIRAAADKARATRSRRATRRHIAALDRPTTEPRRARARTPLSSCTRASSRTPRESRRRRRGTPRRDRDARRRRARR